MIAGLEIIVSIITDFKNGCTLNCYEQCLLINEISVVEHFSICDDISVINWSYSLNCFINNSHRSFNNFMSSVVEILLTANNNGHTGKKNAIGIISKVVNVVAAVFVFVLYVKTVCLRSGSLGEYTGNDTLYCNKRIIFCSSIFCKGVNLEHGNEKVKLERSGITRCIGNSSGKNVLEIFVCILVNVNGDSLVAIFFGYNDSNLFGIYCPSNLICNACNHNLGNNSKVRTCLVALQKIAVKCLDVFLCKLQVGSRGFYILRLGLGGLALRLLGSGSFGCSGCVCASGILGAACSKDRKAHKHCQTNCN